MTDLVIPDSIQPYTGWKALRMEDGHLVSPQQYARWPKKQPLKAECRNAASQHHFEWEQVDAPEGWEDEFWIPARFLREGANTTFSWPPEPAPKGKTWIPKDLPHQMNGCQCGIYVVDTPDQCSWYLNGHTDRVLCSIAVWGQTVTGDKGARGEYAYPQKIMAAEQQAHQARPIAEAYGIEIEVVTFYYDTP